MTRGAALALVASLPGLAAAADGPQGARWGAASEGWSRAVLEQSRQADRPVLLIVSDFSCAACVAAESAAAADATLSARMTRDFLVVPVDRLVRPDLADVFGLAVREMGGGDGFPVLVAVTPDGTPYLGRAGPGAFEPVAFDRFATDAVAGFRAARSGLDTRAVAVVETLRAAQAPSAALRPLGPDAVDATTRALVGWSELGRADGAVPHAAIRFLLAEHERARRPELLKLATTALDLRLARGLAPADSAAEEAQRLGTWTRAFAASGAALHRTEAARSADRLLRARDAQGLWPASAGHPQVIAQVSGLAIGALALSARTLGREGDRDAAVAAASAVRTRLGGASALLRVESGSPAFLDDYAALLDGLLELYETTDDPRWRTEAQALAEAAIGRFLDVGAGGFFLTDAAHDPLPVRVKHAFDGSLPSANGTMAGALPRLARATGEPRYAELARRTADAFLGDLQRAPRGMLTLARAAGAIVGAAPVATSSAWVAPARETRGGVTFEARGPSGPVAAGGAFESVLTLSIAPGTFVVARSGGALDLAGLAVSVPLEGARAAVPRYPEARARRFSWSTDPVAVFEGAATIPIAVTLTPKATAGEHPLRLRVLFQACTDSRCERPESVTLEVPVRIEPAR